MTGHFDWRSPFVLVCVYRSSRCVVCGVYSCFRCELSGFPGRSLRTLWTAWTRLRCVRGRCEHCGLWLWTLCIVCYLLIALRLLSQLQLLSELLVETADWFFVSLVLAVRCLPV